ncbi:hypothetical protein [Jannaschia aquimarina]|uniref:Transmembrane protein n=1 Tax=Jannaschia aquimarina TaxID=935700 RepID=A0A0D1EHP8_9RHOB|nr:hypothetical protein [Jannaschia aquimarina]KIT15320.1 hypothetical protein jaqu_29350 [Jannaschia aquimarina]SNS51187.1 hypothetical protein SAMN05421775_101249 [Jannaschia aquimarina]
MKRSSLVILHAVAGSVALLTVFTFWTSAVVAELAFGHSGIAAVRTGILYALPILVVALAAAGGSGSRLAGRSAAPIIRGKQRRMRLAAANGLLVLVPSAIFLAWKAWHGAFDAAFTTVQAVELVAGAINIVLLGLNMRAGMRMRARRIRAHACGSGVVA